MAARAMETPHTMTDKSNDTRFTAAIPYEFLRSTVRHYVKAIAEDLLATPEGRASALEACRRDPYLDDYADVDVQREINKRVQERMGVERAAVETASEATEAARPVKLQASRPELPATADGLEEAMRLCSPSWELRWNETADQPEARRKGEPHWRACVADVLDDLLYACSEAAQVRRGAMLEPWGLRGARMERRIVGVVARRRPEAGEGSATFHAVLEWAGETRGRRMPLHAVLKACDVRVGRTRAGADRGRCKARADRRGLGIQGYAAAGQVATDVVVRTGRAAGRRSEAVELSTGRQVRVCMQCMQTYLLRAAAYEVRMPTPIV